MVRVIQRLLFIACSFTLLGVGFRPGLADTWDKKTILTVRQPVMVPGPTVLRPGKYVMKLMDSPSSRNVVQIFDDDGMNLITTFIAVSDYRLRPTDKTQFTYAEMPNGTPAIKEWFYPGDLTGLEFVYPKGQRVEMARINYEPPPRRESRVDTSMTVPIQQESTVQERTTQERTVAQDTTRRSRVDTRREESRDMAAVTPADRTRPSTSTRGLPRTASEWPLWALIGGLSLGAGAVLRLVAKRVG